MNLVMEWNFKKHFITSLAVVFLAINTSYISDYLFLVGIVRDSIFSADSAASIAIIGGSDGPTAIYRTYGSISDWGEYIVFMIVLLSLYWPFRRFVVGNR